MPYPHRYSAPRRSGSAELAYLLVALAAGVATAWWAGGKIGMDLSALTAGAAILGLADTGRVAHGNVGYTPVAKAGAAELAAAAPYCEVGQSPGFAFGLAALKQRLGDTMGAPVECEHPASASGDTVQQTTTGLAAYTRATNTVSFTDGWRHWAITPRGFVSWEGPESNPPAGQ